MKNKKKKFNNKKPDATPCFCKQNFSRMHHFDFIHRGHSCKFLIHGACEGLLSLVGAGDTRPAPATNGGHRDHCSLYILITPRLNKSWP